MRKTCRTKSVDSTKMNWPDWNSAKDSADLQAVVEGRVNFGESEPRKEPCGSYTLYFSWEDNPYKMVLENCPDTVHITALIRVED